MWGCKDGKVDTKKWTWCCWLVERLKWKTHREQGKAREDEITWYHETETASAFLLFQLFSFSLSLSSLLSSNKSNPIPFSPFLLQFDSIVILSERLIPGETEKEKLSKKGAQKKKGKRRRIALPAWLSVCLIRF